MISKSHESHVITQLLVETCMLANEQSLCYYWHEELHVTKFAMHDITHYSN